MHAWSRTGGSRCSSLSYPRDQLRQFEQLLEAKRGPAGGDRDEGFDGENAGPLSAYRGQPTRVVVEEHAEPAPIPAVRHQRELTPAERVEGMSDAKGLAVTIQIGRT
jgi:hypothetical protein